MKKACYNCGSVDHLSYNCGKWVDHGRTWAKNNNTHKSRTPRTVFHKTGRPPMRTNRPYMNAAQSKRTSFYKPSHSYNKRPFHRTSAVRSQFRGPRVATVNRNFPTVNRKFPTVNRKFLTGNIKFSTADIGNKGKANHIDDKGYWDSGCSRHMTGNISYLSNYEPFDEGCVSFGQGGCKITGKGTINTCKLKFKNVYFVKDLKKVIKREFSNARTSQQNGVAEKRNMTLIEAARTMLADAKLPVTFWAEAINTACYVQNKVLVNKSQNKTPYELFSGRTSAIGFLKPFGCHVMILNTLDNLRKFDAKGDEGYFIGYSMSSKAFRVFNKRTKRVEENLHVEFLENKPIEKGAGPNWLFDIDSLTKSMNYVPVVVAGTNSTNFLGTKEAAGQYVKKDVSYLRYIVLPNWFHETHLETSTSNAQDACNADAPESNGNSNPTATLINPPADHMETLAVETPIPIVSSLVPTACLNDSPEPSSDTRLISKRVTSQDDMPSLDNILTLTNRFEDILRVTTNTVDTN
nr:ribonuclease H-like domain-containing protein [Tanacetum cinerariifolium]